MTRLSDVLARRALWSDGLDYRYARSSWLIEQRRDRFDNFRHGTSHGVGAFLNVHEGPQGDAYNEIPLRAGMVIAIEPGYYADGKFGVRIENIDVIKMAETRENFGNKGYLELEHVTMVRRTGRHRH